MFTTTNLLKKNPARPPTYYIDMEDGKRFFQIETAPRYSGAEGAIYSFKDAQGKKYAVKKIVSLDREILASSRNEMKFMGMLNGYCGRRSLLDPVTRQYIVYLAMEWLEGETLQKTLDESNFVNQIALFIVVLAKTIRSLQDKKINHNDLTEENILVNQQKKQIYFIDFSRSQIIDEKRQFSYSSDAYTLSNILKDILKSNKEEFQKTIFQKMDKIANHLQISNCSLHEAYNELLKIFLSEIEDFSDTLTVDNASFLIQSMIEMKKNNTTINALLIGLVDNPQDILTTQMGVSLFGVAILHGRYSLVQSWAKAGWLPSSPRAVNKIFGSCLDYNKMATAFSIFSMRPNVLDNCYRIKNNVKNNVFHFLFKNLEKKHSAEDRKKIYYFIGKILLKHPELFFQKNNNNITPKMLLEGRLRRKLTEDKGPENSKEIACLQQLSEWTEQYIAKQKAQVSGKGLSIFNRKSGLAVHKNRKDFSSGCHYRA